MKHGRKIHKLGRPTAARKALLRALATSLFRHNRIRTTLPKAKGLRPFAERLVTHAKSGTPHARRVIQQSIQDMTVVAKLMSEIGPKYKDRRGGYTRILRVGSRLGDNASMALIELV